ncbi:nucleotidyltransferase family protein [Patescibacteria group bacterium]|nr:nucleotidyltransferase family protein [Patescibacteria group bacterium]MBU4162158.1 nucleotidyltransferase family protein [Patescibacteria group bacterium]
MAKLIQIQKNLKELEPILKDKFKVKKIGVFGSYVKNKQKKSSDLDLLVEFSEPISLFSFIGLENYLKIQLKLKVDLVMKDALKSRIKDGIIKETVYV